MEATKPPPAVLNRLLIVEDQPGIPAMFTAWVAHHMPGMLTVEHASSVEMGLQTAPGAVCVLLDLNIDDKWTCETTPQVIKFLSESAPVIVLTGETEGSFRKDLEFASELISEWGADAVVFKDRLMGESGMEWLATAINAAIGRRLYKAKSAKESLANEAGSLIPEI